MYVITLVTKCRFYACFKGGVPRFAPAIYKNSERSLKKIKSFLSEVKKKILLDLGEKNYILLGSNSYPTPQYLMVAA